MTDARIITREELLEFTRDIAAQAFEMGYELGQKMACLEKPGVTSIEASGHKFITNRIRLPHVDDAPSFVEAVERMAKNSPRGE